MKKLLVLVIMLFALDAAASSEMRALDFLVGEWKGDAWIQMGPKKEHAIQTERVQSKVGGEVLLIEGLGKRKLEDGSAGEVVHDAMGVVSWNKKTGAYQFNTHVAGREGGNAKLEVTARTSSCGASMRGRARCVTRSG